MGLLFFIIKNAYCKTIQINVILWGIVGVAETQKMYILLFRYFVWLFLKYHLTMYSFFYRYHCSPNHSWICQKSVPTIQRIFTIYQCELNGQAWTQDQTNNKHKQENMILIVPPNSLSQTIISLFSLVWWEKENNDQY